MNPLVGHVGVSAESLGAGLLHPIGGPDHLLAMVAVGIISTRQGRRSIWLVPLLFVSAMTVGATWTSRDWISMTTVETAVALSVVLLGSFIVVRVAVWPPLVGGVVASFGFFHGAAHGWELPAVAIPEMFTVGFVVSTVGLHVIGVLLGLIAEESPEAGRWMCYGGAAMAITGASLVALG